jgi:hypothetical protein
LVLLAPGPNHANLRNLFLGFLPDALGSDTMSKPKWAPRHEKWGPVKPGFWDIWHANKESLQKNGYSVRRNDLGQWEVRFVARNKSGWPVPKQSPVFVPTGMKASICFRCGQVQLIKITEEHQDCTMCGERICSDSQMFQTVSES